MTRLPIRLRLALLFAVATAVVLAAAGWFLYARVASDLADSLDTELRSRAQDLSALVRREGSLNATRGTLVEHGEAFAELLAANGRVLDATKPIGASLLSPADLARARHGPLFLRRPSVPGLDERARLLAVPVGGRVLVVGATLENRAETLHTLRTAFLIGGPVALLLATLGGYLLAGAALRPIESMRRRAAEISTSSLHERLPVPRALDEVARLGNTLNTMLARIEDGVRRERRFVADASHELRTPLATLKTELELALRGERPREELEEAIRSAADETDRVARIAEGLLLLARSEQGRLPLQLEPTDANDVLRATAARFRAVEVEPNDVPPLAADRLRLEQALGNIVDNALRHGGGRVVLSAETRNGTVELHVRDGGPGFPPAFLEHAFERFSRGDVARGGEGTGLGLAIVATIARAHGGEAQAANRPGGGADVWLALPALEGEPDPEADQHDAGEAVEGAAYEGPA